MLNWAKKLFCPPQAKTPEVIPSAAPLTRQERLQAILISYKTGKISVDQTMKFIHIWSIRRDK